MNKMRKTMNDQINIKKLAAGMILLCMMMFTVAGGRAQAAEPSETWYTVTVGEPLTTKDADNKETGRAELKVYVSGELIDAGSVRKSDKKTLVTKKDKDLEKMEGTLNGSEEYYRLPSGYQVVSGSAVAVKRTISGEGIAASAIHFWQKNGSSYESLNFENDGTAVISSVGADIQVGCDWKVASIKVTRNTVQALGYDGRIVEGTELKESDFVVDATLTSGGVVRLDASEYELDTDKVPALNKKEGSLKVTVAYLKDQNVSNVTTTLSVTNYLIQEIIVSSDEKYHQGDAIDVNDIVVSLIYLNVTTKATSTEKLTKSEKKEVVLSAAYVGNVDPNLDIFPVTVTYRTWTTVCNLKAYGITRLTAEYTGDNLVVGQEYSDKELKVTAYFDDGTNKKLDTEGYDIINRQVDKKKITAPGSNIFTIAYRYPSGELELVNLKAQTTFSINGVAKALEKIEAKYIGPDIVRGGSIATSYVQVTAYYNDGSEQVITTGFLLSTTIVEKLGENKITVTYEGKSTTMTVVGGEKTPAYIIAQYTGEAVIAGGKVDPNNITVTAYYNDATYETVTDFSLSMDTLTAVGINTITVTYKTATAPIYVMCNPRVATAIEAVYKGPEIVQGSSFNRDYVIVTATFNDGSVEQVTDFILYNTRVTEIGTNSYEITYSGLKTVIKVEGIAKTVTGKGTLELDVSNELYDDVTVTAIIQGQLVKENMVLDVEPYEQDDLKKVVRKTTKKGDYIGFELDVEGYEFVDNQYMTMQITIPEGFDPDRVAVYYTPNRKSVMARLGGGLISSDVYEFYAYRSGTYVLVECDKSTLKDADLRGSRILNPFICVSGIKPLIQEGEKLELKATLLHATSTTSSEMSWHVDDSDVATINSNGVLTAWSSGYVEVTVQTKDGKYSHSFEIEVE